MATLSGPSRIPHVYVVRQPNPTKPIRRLPPIKYNRMMSAPATSTPASNPVNAKQIAKARENLHARLQKNWMTKNPENRPLPDVDDSLTSLGWLQNLSVMRLSSPTPPDTPPEEKITSAPDSRCISPSNTSVFDPTVVNPNSILNMPHTPSNTMSGGLFIKQEPETVSFGGNGFESDNGQFTAGMENIDYRTNATVKPPFSYATLICMAMRDSSRKKITLSGIYKWITENFMYYRIAEPSWQNSIRHNLSLNKCFQKVARRKDEPGGKGGFWKISPNCDDSMVNGILMKRRTSFHQSGGNGLSGLDGPACKKIKRENSTGVMDFDYMNADGLEDDDDELEVDIVKTIYGDQDQEFMLSNFMSQQETESAVFNLPGATAAEEEEGNMGDFSWSETLNKDIDVNGLCIKTEELLKDEYHASESIRKLSQGADISNSTNIVNDVKRSATPITDLSPPPSDSNSDLGMDDLLNFTTDLEATNSGDSLDIPLDFLSGDPLDLTVSGTGLSKPEGWDDMPDLLKSLENNNSRLNTPVMPSPDHHPWAENKSFLDEHIANFDCNFEELFDTKGST